MQRRTYPVFHCSRHDYKVDCRPVGYADSEVGASRILATVFEGSSVQALIEVELAAVYLGRNAVWAYWRAADSLAPRWPAGRTENR